MRKHDRVHSGLWVPASVVKNYLKGELVMWPKCYACSKKTVGAMTASGQPIFPVEKYELLHEGVKDGRFFIEIGVRCHGKHDALRIEYDQREAPPAQEQQKAIAALVFFEDKAS